MSYEGAGSMGSREWGMYGSPQGPISGDSAACREAQEKARALEVALRTLTAKFERVAVRLAALEDAHGITPAAPLHEFTQQQDRAPRFCKWCGCAEHDPDARSPCPTPSAETKP